MLDDSSKRGTSMAGLIAEDLVGQAHRSRSPLRIE